MTAATGQDIEIQVKEFELYPPGLYLARVASVVEEVSQQYGNTQLKWVLEFPDIERSDGETATLPYYTSFATGPKAKLTKLADACEVKLPPPGEKFRASLILDIWVQAYVTQYKRTDGAMGCKIGDLLKLTPKQKKSLTLSMPEAPEPEPEVLAPKAPVSTREAQATAVTKGEDAKAFAVSELVPILRVLIGTLEERGEKLTPSNVGDGLKTLVKAARSQGVKSIADIAFDLISIATIAQAKTEALALIQGPDEPGKDPFDAFKDE